MTIGETDCAFIILAAGSSSRMGQPKQLLPYKDTTLLGYVINIAVKMGKGPVFVILGAYAEAIRSKVSFEGCVPVFNALWKEGMASSIRTGLQALEEKVPECSRAMFLVCDQPDLQKYTLQSLIETQNSTGKYIVAAAYAGVAGTPALFSRQVFSQLYALKGDKGAKSLLQVNMQHLAVVDFEKGVNDIDTLEDYDYLIKEKGSDDKRYL